MELIGSIVNQGSLQGQINDANGYLTGIISNAGLLGGQVVAERGLKGDKGDTGDTGATGNGIASVSKTGSSGNVDTYTITYTNGSTVTFTVTNGIDGHSPIITASKVGKTTTIYADGTAIGTVVDGADGVDGVDGTDGVGISSITKTSTSGLVDTYTITFTDTNTTTFDVTNGKDGIDGVDGTDGVDGYSPTATVTKSGDTATITITDKNGTTTQTVSDGTDGTDGQDGHSPVVTASKVGKVTTVSVDGSAIATINDGTDGQDGVVQDVTVNGTSVLDGATAKVLVPTKTSDLNNDSLFSRGHVANFHGTCSSSASATEKAVTCADFKSTDLVAGAIIVVSFTNTNSGAVGSLTLNVNGTGAYGIKRNNSGTIGSLDSAGYIKGGSSYMFYFDGTYWVLTAYDTNTNTIGYTIRTNGLQLKTKTACYRYRLCFTSADGEYLVPANSSTSTSATASKTVTTEKIDPWGRIVYYNTTTAVAANSYPSASYLVQQYNGVALGYSFNRTGVALTLTNHLPVYVKCTPQNDGSAIIDGTTPFVQALPTTEDGKIYIFIGVATAATSIEFTLEHPVYYYKDSQIRLWTNQTSSGGGGVTEIFVAEYNVTSFSDIDTAYNAGKTVFCVNDVYGDGSSIKILPLVDYYDSGTHQFYNFVNDSSLQTYHYSVRDDDDWSSNILLDIRDVKVDNTSVVDPYTGVADIDLTGKADAVHTHTKSDVTDFAHTHTKSEISDFPSIPTITDTYSGTSSDGMSGKAVKSAIDALDGTVSGTAGAGKTLTAFSQTDGKVSATFGNISITKSQVSDFPTIPTVNNATLTIQKNSTNVATFTANASSNVTANISVPTDTGDLTNGAGFITASSIPQQVFIAEYGTTTFTEVKDAYDDGLALFCHRTIIAGGETQHYIFPLLGYADTSTTDAFAFSGNMYNSNIAWAVDSNDTWSENTVSSVLDVQVNGTSVLNGSVAEITLPTMGDYVVEQGFSSSWYYQKWNSGFAQCWRVFTFTSAMNSSLAGGYSSSTNSPAGGVAYPFTFTDVPNEECYYSKQNNVTGFPWQYVNQTASTCGKWCLWRANSSSSTVTKTLVIHARGSWK